MNKMIKILSVVFISVLFSSFTNAQIQISASGKADGRWAGLSGAQLLENVRLKGYTASFYDKTIYGSFSNVFKRQGEVVTDYATGLMWQRSTSGPFSFTEAQGYINQLNQHRFAGYSNWRIPTAIELASLTQTRGFVVGGLNTLLHIDPNFFDENAYYCMSCDLVSDPSLSSEAVFIITWAGPGIFGANYVNQRYPVKAVRTIK